MNSEKLKKRQSMKIIASEAIMVLVVIVTVVILALVVSGYWINSDFEVERQGMLQIASSPTGANINIDGETSSWPQRTNTSKVLSTGEHTIVLTRDGYDSWSKTINIREGLLYRLNYPRLFPQDRTTKKVIDTTSDTMAFVSANHNYMVLANDSDKWSLVRLDSDRPEPKPLDVSSIIPSSGIPVEAVLNATWDNDASHILFQILKDEATEWLLLDVNHPSKSINLTKEFAGNFTKVEILDNSSNNLLVIQNHNLQKIDVANSLISAVLVEDVVDFDHYDNEIIFSASVDESNLVDDTPESYYVGMMKLGDDKATKVINTSVPPQVAISKFYDEKYLTVIEETKVTLYRKSDFEKYVDYDISFEPQSIVVGHDGEFIIMQKDLQIATVDMEASALREWSLEGTTFGWLDNNMVYTVLDGELNVYDYDGFNGRKIAKNVSSRFPASITDDRWLYYFSDNNLVRENLSK